MVCHEIIRTFPGIIVIKHGSAVRSGLSWYSKNNQIQPPLGSMQMNESGTLPSSPSFRCGKSSWNPTETNLLFAWPHIKHIVQWISGFSATSLTSPSLQLKASCCAVWKHVRIPGSSGRIEVKGKMRLTLRWTGFCTTSWCSSHCRCAPVAGCWRCVASWDILRRRSASARRPTGRVPRDRNRRHPALPALPDRRGECVRILIQISFS